MVVEIKCCVNSTNQHAQRPCPAPESSGPLKKYYLTNRDFLWGKFVPRTLFSSWFLQWKHTEYQPKVPSSCGGKGAIAIDFHSIYFSLHTMDINGYRQLFGNSHSSESSFVFSRRKKHIRLE